MAYNEKLAGRIIDDQAATIERLMAALEAIIGEVKPAANGGDTDAISVLLLATRAFERESRSR